MNFFSGNIKKLTAACAMLLFAFFAHAQQDSVRADKSIEAREQKPFHSPKKATLYSTFLPGLGQAYNKKYWKIPIVYAGLATSIYFIIWNQEQYNIYSEAFDIQAAGGIDQFNNYYSIQNLITYQNYYRDNRDLSIIITVLIYGLNIIDANIDAHLFDFDVSEDLSFRLEPALFRGSNHQGTANGLRLTLQF